MDEATTADADGPSLGNGRYRLLSLIGRGASGEVHRARDLATGVEVALKRLRSPTPEEAFHLKREFRALADVRHAGLARLYDLGIDENECFFTMDLVRGEDLAAFVERAATSTSRVEIARRLLPPLVDAVRAVHALGIVHRDLKPANILVEAERSGETPRLVVIDFGLLAPIVPDLRDSAALAELAGTIEYMAPEQLWGGPVGEAADWYAVGSLLFQILAGRPPFSGDAVEIATAKATGTVPRLPDDEARSEWLDALVLDLLARRPEDRPTGQTVRRLLHDQGFAHESSSGSVPPTPQRRSGGWQSGISLQSPFFGRESERGMLDEALARTEAGRIVVARVRGSSGIGKSELLQRFTRTAEEDDRVVVLRGRCHAYEAIPRKGLDQVVDDLSRHLQLDEEACGVLDAESAGALLRLFPVLGRVAALAKFAGAGSSMDPQRLRRTGVLAFGALVAAVGAARPLVVWIDDVQWADGESAELLEAVIHTGGLAHTMFLLSYRSEAESASPMLAVFERLAEERADRFLLDLQPLDEDASRSFVEELMKAGDHLSGFDVAGIVQEGAGSPFFLGELVRSIADGTGSAVEGGATLDRAIPRIEDVVARRTSALPPVSRRLLEVVSLAGAALAEQTSVGATGEAGARHALGELERQCLVRTLDGPAGRVVQPWHDRIAEGVRARLDPSQRVSLHGRIADALEAEPVPDLELLVLHWSRAEQLPRAARHALPAADRAAQTLAFERAAELYAFAMQHGDATADRHAIGVGLAEALANAGRGAEAGAAFEEAARRLAGRDVGDVEVLELRRKGAEQLLRCGQIDEGIARIREVLAVFGERLPRTAAEAMRSFVWQRARLLLRGTKPREHGPSSPSQAVTTKLNAMWSTTIAVSMVDLSLAGAVQVRHFLEALDLGEPERLALAFAHEATWRSALGPRMRRHAIPALEEARRRIAQSDSAYPRAWTTMAEGIVRWQSGLFSAASPLLEDALAIYRRRCQGVFFETALTGMYTFTALALSGRLARLSDLVREEMVDARRRRDRFAHHGCLMGQTVFAWLADDDPETAISQADAAIAEWPSDRFLMQHYHHLLTTVQAELYRGRGVVGFEKVEATWKRLARGGYLWLECPSLELHSLRGRAALQAASESRTNRERLDRLRIAAKSAAAMEKSALPPAAGLAACLRAGLAAADGDEAKVRRLLNDARTAYDAADMRMHAAAAGWTLERKGQDGSVVEPADSWARMEGCRDLERLSHSLIPLPSV